MRESKLQYFMRLAEDVATQATCDRAHVGCVLVRGERIIATGYNGSPPHMDHCDEVGHDIEGGHCIRVIHAEENALIQCAREGVSSKDTIAYCTHHPCVRCAARLYAAGVDTVIWKHTIKSMTPADLERIAKLEKVGFSLRQFVA